MRLCKDCWFCWVEKGVCCHPQATRDYTTGRCINSVHGMRWKEGPCKENGILWRPKLYSPDKTYTFHIECPVCQMIYIADLWKDDSGKRECKKCNRELWLPGYGVNEMSVREKNKRLEQLGMIPSKSLEFF